MSPFNCKLAPTTACEWILFTLGFILGFVLIPPIIFFGIVTEGTVKFMRYCCRGLLRYIRAKSQGLCGEIFYIFFVVPVFFATFVATLVAILIPIATIALAIAIVPAYLFHMYYFLRTLYWWCKMSRTHDE